MNEMVSGFVNKRSLLYLVIVLHTVFMPMTPDQDTPSEQVSLSGSDALASQVAELIQLVGSGEETNIQQTLPLVKDSGNLTMPIW
jgi:TPP-dependent indolepyruvate ferredoxin oxidoreductase alpha subunit